MASMELSPLPSFIEELDVLLSDWEYVHRLDIYLYTIYTQSCYSLSFTGCFIGNSSCIVLIHGIWIFGIFLSAQSCLHYSRGSMIHYLIPKGILGTLICYTLGYSFPQTTFLSLLKVFGVLEVFNEAQSQRDCVYKRELFRSLPFTVVVGMRIEGECWI
jgi:hypothetical protein